MTYIGACRIGQNKIFFGAEKVVALVHYIFHALFDGSLIGIRNPLLRLYGEFVLCGDEIRRSNNTVPP